MALIKLFSNTERFENQPGNYYKYAKNVKKKKTEWTEIWTTLPYLLANFSVID